MVTHIDVDRLEVSRHLGVEVDLLVRAEFGGQLEVARQVLAGHRHHRHARRVFAAGGGADGLGPGARAE